jgi:hypothetical protein
MPPIDPHTTWALTGDSLFGLQRDAVPTHVDLHSPRVGRVFKWQPDGSPHATYLTIFPADPDNPLCPPYPGIPPAHIYDSANPVACFSDSGLGKWDPRYFPQVYDPARPWLPFHHAPRPVSWWYGHDPRQPGYDYFDPRIKDEV